jgi:hypothetical protein
MRRFMITFNHIEGAWDQLSPARQTEHEGWPKDFVAKLRAEKQSELVFMAPAPGAKTVRMDEQGKVEVLDGPHLEAAEQPGGYYIVEADTMEEAVEWARLGRFMVGSNEVREIFAAPF